MISSEEDFARIVQSRIAPIYFFDKKSSPQVGEKLTTNGTLTLWKSNRSCFGITNYHVFKYYLDKKRKNPNYICQIGYKLFINLEERKIFEDEENDLIVFFLHEQELKEIATKGKCKGGFCRLADISLFETEQKLDDPNSWYAHFAGFPCIYKVTEKLSEFVVLEDFGIFLAPAPFACYPRKIAINFEEARKAIEKGILLSDIGPLDNEKINFGGISGGPFFARHFPYHNDLTLLGILYEGSSGTDLIPEVLYVRPITLIKDILDKN